MIISDDIHPMMDCDDHGMAVCNEVAGRLVILAQVQSLHGTSQGSLGDFSLILS
jgi:hypothetical protein